MCQGGKKNGQSELGSDGYIRADFMGWSSRKWEKSNGWLFLVLLKSTVLSPTTKKLGIASSSLCWGIPTFRPREKFG